MVEEEQVRVRYLQDFLVWVKNSILKLLIQNTFFAAMKNRIMSWC